MLTSSASLCLFVYERERQSEWVHAFVFQQFVSMLQLNMTLLVCSLKGVDGDFFRLKGGFKRELWWSG